MPTLVLLLRGMKSGYMPFIIGIYGIGKGSFFSRLDIYYIIPSMLKIAMSQKT